MWKLFMGPQKCPHLNSKSLGMAKTNSEKLMVWKEWLMVWKERNLRQKTPSMDRRGPLGLFRLFFLFLSILTVIAHLLKPKREKQQPNLQPEGEAITGLSSLFWFCIRASLQPEEELTARPTLVSILRHRRTWPMVAMSTTPVGRLLRLKQTTTHATKSPDPLLSPVLNFFSNDGETDWNRPSPRLSRSTTLIRFFFFGSSQWSGRLLLAVILWTMTETGQQPFLFLADHGGKPCLPSLVLMNPREPGSLLCVSSLATSTN